MIMNHSVAIPARKISTCVGQIAKPSSVEIDTEYETGKVEPSSSTSISSVEELLLIGTTMASMF